MVTPDIFCVVAVSVARFWCDDLTSEITARNQTRQVMRTQQGRLHHRTFNPPSQTPKSSSFQQRQQTNKHTQWR